MAEQKNPAGLPAEGEQEAIVIDDLEAFRVVDNPLRQRIWHLSRNPLSVKEIAQRLGVPVTRLYYHVNMLEEHGFLEVAEIRKSGAQLERVYRGRKGTIVPSKALIEEIGDPAKAARILAGALFDNTRVEVETLLEKNARGQEVFGTVARGIVELPHDVAAGFADRIDALAAEIREAAQETTDESAGMYSFTYAFVPTESS